MSEHVDHDQIEELLAGYALQSLEGDDAQEADRLLDEHVPSCATCRHTLADFQSLVGDLALATPAMEPSDLLWPQIRRSMGDAPGRRSRHWATWAVAASMVAIFGLAGWNVFLSSRVSQAESEQKQVSAMIKKVVGDDGRRMITLRDDSREPTLFASYLPGQPMGRLGGVGLPQPASGSVYAVWLVRFDGSTTPAAEFMPSDDGIIMIEFGIDLTDYSEIRITEEPMNQPGGDAAGPAPTGQVKWSALIYPS